MVTVVTGRCSRNPSWRGELHARLGEFPGTCDASQVLQSVLHGDVSIFGPRATVSTGSGPGLAFLHVVSRVGAGRVLLGVRGMQQALHAAPGRSWSCVRASSSKSREWASGRICGGIAAGWDDAAERVVGADANEVAIMSRSGTRVWENLFSAKSVELRPQGLSPKAPAALNAA